MHMLKRGLSIIVALASLLASPLAGLAEAGPAASAAKRATRAVSRFTRAEWARLAKLDRAAHRAAPTTVLTKPQTVTRYVSRARARYEAKHGFQAWTHFTGPVRRGRPLSATTASERFVLPRQPQAVETVTLPVGTSIKRLRVTGGKGKEVESVLVKHLRSAVANIRRRALK